MIQRRLGSYRQTLKRMHPMKGVLTYAAKKGMIVLMGSGELTPTMVEVHKEILSKFPKTPEPVFMDTPAGFQLNVDEISQKAVEYFDRHVQSPLTIASIKSAKDAQTYEFQSACKILEEANYILIGPGSPTYAVRQWTRTQVPDILADNINNGGCLVAASAAALTLGRFTLPVYEIYKVGQNLHWVDGMDTFKQFGLDLVVVPHWNNAEGGTHDTRFCYMGRSRFEQLRSLLPEDIGILGMDEHTACIINFKTHQCEVRGVGEITYLHRNQEIKFAKGERFSLDVLYGKKEATSAPPAANNLDFKKSDAASECSEPQQDPYVHAIKSCEKEFQQGLIIRDPKTIADTLLEMENLIWESRQSSTDDHCVGQAREILKKSFASLGEKIEHYMTNETESFIPLVNALMALRDQYRGQKKFNEADAIRDCLEDANIKIEDKKSGSSWKIEI